MSNPTSNTIFQSLRTTKVQTSPHPVNLLPTNDQTHLISLKKKSNKEHTEPTSLQLFLRAFVSR
ncbi:hypothetical protein LX36DRAFT_663125 [Colletotrichum falcatum]|nr:hypothetical protein LX36DRAFT_663125 [Colletotrichum falcatum]